MNKIANTISVIDMTTGEVIDISYENADQLKDMYKRAEGLKKAIDNAMRKMKVDMEIAVNELGNGQEYQFADGHRLKMFQPERKEYRKVDVAKYLDADQLDVVLQVNNSAVKSLFKEMMAKNELPDGAFKDVEANAYIKQSTPYVRLLDK